MRAEFPRCHYSRRSLVETVFSTTKRKLQSQAGCRLEAGRRAMAMDWSRDVDQSLSEAQRQKRPMLLDFSAAPA